MATSDFKKMITVIFDLRQTFANDNRMTSMVKVLQNTAILRQSLVTRSYWSHFSLMAIKEGSTKVIQLQSLEDWENIHKTHLIHAFNQLKVLVKSEVDELNDSDKKKVTLYTTLQNAVKEFKGIKAAEGELSVTIVTLRWEGYVKDEIREFCHSGMETISNLKIIEITGYENRFTYTDRIHVYSLPVKGVDIAAESLFKQWVKDIPTHFIIILRSDTKDMEIVTRAESTMVELETKRANSGGEFAMPTNLTVTSFIPKRSLCQTMLYGSCRMLTARGTEADNYHRFTAISRFMMYDKGLVAVIQGFDSSGISRKLILIPGCDEKMMAHPIIADDLINVSLQHVHPAYSSQAQEIVDDVAKKLPVYCDYGLGCQVNLVSYLEQKFSHVLSNKAQSLGSTAAHVVKHNPTKYLHPALGMYQ